MGAKRRFVIGGGLGSYILILRRCSTNPRRDDIAENTRADVLNRFTRTQPGVNQVATAGTAYGLFNAVEDYRQYGYGSYPTTAQKSTRLNSVWFGGRAGASRNTVIETIVESVQNVVKRTDVDALIDCLALD